MKKEKDSGRKKKFKLLKSSSHAQRVRRARATISISSKHCTNSGSRCGQTRRHHNQRGAHPTPLHHHLLHTAQKDNISRSNISNISNIYSNIYSNRILQLGSLLWVVCSYGVRQVAGHRNTLEQRYSLKSKCVTRLIVFLFLFHPNHFRLFLQLPPKWEREIMETEKNRFYT